MKSISTAVENIIYRSPFLKELITLQIVNLSGLARQLKSTVEEDTQKLVTDASIMVALKRLTKRISESSQDRKTIFTVKPELTVRSNLFEITVKNSPSFFDKQKKLLSFATAQQNHFITFTYGLFETTTVASNQVREMAVSLYRDEQIVSVVENISTITIKFPNDIVDLPFIYYTILRTLAWSGISIIEMISTYSELVLVLDQKDIELAFSLMKKLFTSPSALLIS